MNSLIIPPFWCVQARPHRAAQILGITAACRARTNPALASTQKHEQHLVPTFAGHTQPSSRGAASRQHLHSLGLSQWGGPATLDFSTYFSVQRANSLLDQNQ